ncbi:MAG: hypothetical protein JJE22_12020 [Bacteroidia bacterium]|nr:hypothetical protein [Bacteroidia bacterium]
MKKYEIVLQNEKAKTYPTISWLIVVLNFIAFLYFGISRTSKNISYPFIAAAILIFIFLWFLSIKKDSKPATYKFRFFFSVIILSWIIIHFYWAAAINLFLFIIQDITSRSLVVLFSEEEIIYPSFPKRTIQWQQLNNVILKDGILTIDCKNNRVYQDAIDSDVNEASFNDFCNEQLKLSVSI